MTCPRIQEALQVLPQASGDLLGGLAVQSVDPRRWEAKILAVFQAHQLFSYTWAKTPAFGGGLDFPHLLMIDAKSLQDFRDLTAQ